MVSDRLESLRISHLTEVNNVVQPRGFCCYFVNMLPGQDMTYRRSAEVVPALRVSALMLNRC